MPTISADRIEWDDPRDFLCYRPGSGGTVEIFDLQVGTDRRKGIGRGLVTTLIEHCLPSECNLVWAITRADNFIAQEFYHSLKFRVVAPLRNFYGVKDENGKETTDAIMYGLDIKPKEQA